MKLKNAKYVHKCTEKFECVVCENLGIICTLYCGYTRLPCVCENGENNFMTWLFDVCSLTSLEIRINNMPGWL